VSQTSISWTNCVWNPITGCSTASAGCRNCYASRLAGRLALMGQAVKYGGLTNKINGKIVWTGDVRLSADTLLTPLSWRKPKLIFVNSMSDWAHKRMPKAWRDQILAVAALAPQHVFQALTKRAGIARDYLNDPKTPGRVEAEMRNIATRQGMEPPTLVWPLPNWWSGVSVENQEAADERLPIVGETCAAVRFASVEPMLGPVQLGKNADCLEWLICGGESGPGARPFAVEWADTLVKECQQQAIAVFVKQLGKRPTFNGADLVILNESGRKDGHGGEPEAWPAELQHLNVREFPLGVAQYRKGAADGH
jgi:protein gp37